MGDYVVGYVIGVYKVSYVKLFGYFDFGWVQVNINDLICICKVQVLNDIQVNVVQIENNCVVVDFYFGGVDYGFDVSGYVVIDIIDFVKWCVWVYFCQCDFRQNSVIGESRIVYVVFNGGVIQY